MKYERYKVSWNEVWKMFFVEDTFTAEEVCSGDAYDDIHTVCECLNVIQYDRN